ncbi:preprotein translocase subunit SecA [Candidatus Dojkabacteria bacterium]|nr:preprotein translocase subunit SecA [Candidatus Dojkabacteria bacterium]
MLNFLSKFFDSNERQLKKFKPIVEGINGLEESVQKLSDTELMKTAEDFRKKLGIDLEKSRRERDPFLPALTEEQKNKRQKDDRERLLEILPEIYARVRESSRRQTNHRHFDVQILAGIFQAHGYVIEHFTGEGKTLVATCPLFLYALMGKGVHLVTVNDYLARRDGEWAGHIYGALGMKVGVITPGAAYKFITDKEAVDLKGDEAQKKIEEREKLRSEVGRLKYDHMSGVNLQRCSKSEAYACDIIYGTNNEFGFDYLRDNMAHSLSQRVQGPLYFAIVDECDSILIDEARTPLIISSQAQDSNEMYLQFANVARQLKPPQDYLVDEKAHSVSLTDEGVDRVEKILSVDNIWENYAQVHHLDNALKAKELYTKDDQYIIKDNQVLIVDEFTGRVLPGRRYSEGLHQAIEAKEGVEIKKESRTLATITFQNYFRLYDFLSGMTATALTEAEEFANIYDLEVVVIPTNLPVIRKDLPDFVFRTKEGKFRAVVKEIKQRHEKGQPMLVGTTSVENSELLSSMLNKEGIAHNVLNAKQHEKEAKIVAEAGKKGQVTIATNMAGRGTDIALGHGVKELGGLHVIGTERHESRRIDNQLRGRSGRQGDPGSSRFYVSFEDDLMRLFGGNAMSGILSSVGMDDSVPIEAGIIGRTIESAQKRVEAYHFDTRKHLVEYDDVLNQQREIIYDLRRKILTILAGQKVDAEGGDTKKKSIKYDFSKLKESAVAEMAQSLSNFSIKDPGSWKILELGEGSIFSRPLRLWVLKLAAQHIDFIIGSQVRDDSKVDDLEERKVLAGVLDVIPVELADEASKKIGYKGWKDLEKKFYSNGWSVEKRLSELHKLLISSYVIHILSLGDEVIGEVERVLILQTIDNLWIEHLDLMTDLRHGIGLRGYAQKNPLVEYKNEGFAMFDKMLAQMEDNIVRRFFKVSVVKKSSDVDVERAQAVKEEASKVSPGDKAAKTTAAMVDRRPGKVSKQKTITKGKKVGRNDPCPCGSGKKYKKCCYPKYE